MDLGAYANKDRLQHIADKNGIEIPRLRGYRLMSEESVVPQSVIDEQKRLCEVDVVSELCSTRPIWNPNAEFWVSDDGTDILENYYLTTTIDESGDSQYSGIRWDRIHGWKRKILKHEIKKQKKNIQNQYDMFNKYVGRNDVLYIHSRMGGANWENFKGKVQLVRQPWFLDRIDDHFDSTYCDFYAKINIEE